MAGMDPWDEFPEAGQSAPPPPSRGIPEMVIGPRVDPEKAEDQGFQRNSEARAAEAAARQRDADARAQVEWNAKFNPDGSPKLDPSQASEAERTAGFLTNRIVGGVSRMTKATERDPDAAKPSGFVEGVRKVFGDTPANYLSDSERQQVRAAQIDILDAALTLGTGAAYNKEQLEGYREAYFPAIGDTDDTVASKQEALRTLLESARVKAGRAAPSIDEAMGRLGLKSAAEPHPNDPVEAARDAFNEAGAVARSVMPPGGPGDPPSGGDGGMFTDAGDPRGGGGGSPAAPWTAQQAAKHWGSDVYDKGGNPLPRAGGEAYDRNGNFLGIFGEVSAADEASPLPSNLIAQGRSVIAEAEGGPNAATRRIVEDTTKLSEMDGDQTGAAGLMTLAKQGMTAGLYDEASGVGGAAAALLTGEDAQQAYYNNRNATRATVERARKADPFNLGTEAELIGSMGGAGVPRALESAALPTVREITKGAATYGGVAGFGEGNGLDDSLRRAAGGTVIGGATGLALGAGSNKLGQLIASKRAARAADASKNAPDMAVVNAGAAENIPIREADAIASRRGALGEAEASKFGGPIIREGMAADAAAIEGRVADVGGVGNAGDRYAMGSVVQGALERHGDITKKQARLRYGKAAKLAGDTRVEPANAIATIETQIAELQAAGPKANSAEIKYLQDIKADLERPGGLTIQALRDQRTGMRGQIAQRNLDKTQAEGRVSQVLDAAATDIQVALGSKPEALAAFRSADDFWRQRADFRKQITRKLIGQADNPNSPEATARAVESMMQNGGDFNRFSRMAEVLTPEERADLAASVASNLGRNQRGDFSLPFLLKALDPKKGMNPRAVEMVFGADGAKSLANLRVIADAKVGAASERNMSKTANALGQAAGGLKSMLATGLGLAQGGVAGAVVAGAAENFIARWGQERAARALMNPNFTQWIKMAPNTSDPQVINRYVAKLTTIAANSPTIANDLRAFRGVLDEAISQSPKRVAAEPTRDEERDSGRVPPK